MLVTGSASGSASGQCRSRFELTFENEGTGGKKGRVCLRTDTVDYLRCRRVVENKQTPWGCCISMENWNSAMTQATLPPASHESCTARNLQSSLWTAFNRSKLPFRNSIYFQGLSDRWTIVRFIRLTNCQMATIPSWIRRSFVFTVSLTFGNEFCEKVVEFLCLRCQVWMALPDWTVGAGRLPCRGAWYAWLWRDRQTWRYRELHD